MKKNKNITFLDELLINEFGEKGTPDREEFEKSSDRFRLKVKINEMYKKVIRSKKESVLEDYEPYDAKDAVTEVDNYFFTFEYLDLYKHTVQEINASLFHIENNCDLSSKKLIKLQKIVEETNKSYDLYRKEERVIQTEEEAEAYAGKLASIFKFLEQVIELSENN
jgi:hypothetical protein